MATSKVWQLISDAFLDYLNEHPEAFEEGLPQRFVPPGERTICATCGFVLGRHTRDDVFMAWVHQGEVEGGIVYDHPTQPVPESEAEFINNKCDFCNQDHSVAWLYFTKEARGASLATVQYSGVTRTPLGPRGKQVHEKVQANMSGLSEISIRHASADHLWGACDPCAKLIDLRDIERLVTRYRRLHPEFTLVTRNHIKSFWQGVFWSQIWFRIPLPEELK